ncbi:MAG: flagellar basal body P-ring formation chaperone FlgA [Candidatus Margulisiibacteriota bacterium]
MPDFRSALDQQLLGHVLASDSRLTSESVRIRYTLSPLQTQRIQSAKTVTLTLPPEASLIGKTTQTLSLTLETETVPLPLSIEIDAYAHFLKAARTIPARTLIATSDVYVDFESVYGKPKQTFENPAQIVGKQTITVIPKYAIVASWFLQEKPLFLSGKTITVIVKGKQISISLPGIALNDGFKNKSVKIRTKAYPDKLLEGEVLDEDHVQVLIRD